MFYTRLIHNKYNTNTSIIKKSIDYFNFILNTIPQVRGCKVNINSNFEVVKKKKITLTKNELYNKIKKSTKFIKLKSVTHSKIYKCKTFKVFKNFFNLYRSIVIKNSAITFKYLWENVGSDGSFWYSAYSKLKYAWLSFKSVRTNFFSTFYYTGAASKLLVPNNWEYINKRENPKNLKLTYKNGFRYPFKMHPYVDKSKAPFCYILNTCSAGLLGIRKKAKRARFVMDTMKEHFNVYFKHFFSFNNIDFFFFKVNGFSKIFKFIKRTFIYKFRGTSFKFRKFLRKSNGIRKVLKKLRKRNAKIPVFMVNVFKSLANPLYMDNPIPFSEQEEAKILELRHVESQNKYFKRKKRLFTNYYNKMLTFVQRLPKFIYLMDVTSYPFNGCRRVRHYK